MFVTASNLLTRVIRSITPELAKYLIMAVIIVGIEVGSFAVMYSLLNINYLIATATSMAIGIVLNWYFSRLIFKKSKHKAHIEFILVLLASLIGVGIQLAIVAIAVEMLSLVPLLGKLIAIAITFFWNFWIRKHYIFKQESDSPQLT